LANCTHVFENPYKTEEVELWIVYIDA